MAGASPPGASFWAASEACIVCQGDDFSPGHGPRTLVTCESCLDSGVHVECWHRHSGELLTEERLGSPAFQWFCSEGCKKVSQELVALTGVPRELAPDHGSGRDGEYKVELVRWSQKDKGCQKTVGHAKAIFNSAFAPLVMDNGRNLIDMVCEAYESPDTSGGAAGGAGADAPADRMAVDGDGDGEEEEEEPAAYNFSTFRVVLLRKRGIVVSAATVRAFGTSFAEVPFVATREGYRREGHCRRLMQELERVLLGIGVRNVIVPAMRAVLPMWLRKFSYRQFSPEECRVLEERVVMPDPSSAALVHKDLQAAASAAAAAAGKRSSLAAAPAAKKSRSVRFGAVTYAESSDDDSCEDRRQLRRRGSDRRGGHASRTSKDASDPDYEDSSEEEGEEEEGEGEELEEMWQCGRCSRRSDTCIASAATGEMVCDECIQLRDVGEEAEQAPPPAAAATLAAAGDTAGPAGGAALCETCGANGASRRKGTGLSECLRCHRYRQKHKGQPRPEAVWARDKHRQAQARGPAPTKPVARARPAPAGPRRAPPARSGGRVSRRQKAALRRSVRASQRAARAMSCAEGQEAGGGAVREEAQRMLLEQLCAELLAEHDHELTMEDPMMGPAATPDKACSGLPAVEGEAAALACRVQAAEKESAELRHRWREAEAGRQEERAALGRLQARLQGLEAEAERWRQELHSAAEGRVRAAEAAAAERERRASAEVEQLRRRLAAAEGPHLLGRQNPEAEAARATLGAAWQQQVAAFGPAVCLSPVSISPAAVEPNGGVPAPAAADDGGSHPLMGAGLPSPGKDLALSKPMDSGTAATDPLAAPADVEAAADRAPAAEARSAPAAADDGAAMPEGAPHNSRSQDLAAARTDRAPSGSPEDLFGIFRSLGGTSCSSASARASASPMPPASGRKGAENRPPPSSEAALPASPSASLDGVAAAVAGEDGGRQRRRAAKLCLALGSQESCSQGAGVCGAGPPAAAAMAAEASPPALTQWAQVAAALPTGLLRGDAAALGASASPAAAVVKAQAAMLAVDDIARYLAD